jgi:hypothetical protein
MPYQCAVAGCTHKSWRHKTLVFYSFPKDDALRRKWIRNISLRRKDYKWSTSDRVCSAHFVGGRKLGNNNVPTIFPRRDLKSGCIVWPIDISRLLDETQPNSSSDWPVKAVTACNDSTPEHVVCTGGNNNELSSVVDSTENINPLTAPTPSRANSVLQNSGEPERSECSGNEDNKLGKEHAICIETLGTKRFMHSDSDIRFYTGLPDYKTFLAIYQFVKPKPGFQLNYYNGVANRHKDPTYVNTRSREAKKSTRY